MSPDFLTKLSLNRLYNNLQNISVDYLVMFKFRFAVMFVSPDYQIHEVRKEVFRNVGGSGGSSLHVVLREICFNYLNRI